MAFDTQQKMDVKRDTLRTHAERVHGLTFDRKDERAHEIT